MIPFPKMHIAESTINRILNAVEDNDSILNFQMPVPEVPNPELLGAQIESATKTPALPVSVPAEETPTRNAGMLEASVLGGSPFNGALGV